VPIRFQSHQIPGHPLILIGMRQVRDTTKAGQEIRGCQVHQKGRPEPLIDGSEEEMFGKLGSAPPPAP